MKIAKLVTISVVTCLLLAQGAWAADTTAAAAKDAENHPQTAVYQVSELTSGLSKDLVKSLNEIDGILSAKPDTKAGTFSVTFAPDKTDTKTILATLDGVAPQVVLNGVGPADSKQAHGDCSKCPKHKSCAKNKDKG